MIPLNYFDKLDEQSQACLSYAIARIVNRGAKATQLTTKERRRLN